MAKSVTARPGLDLASWLARKIRQDNLRGLPPFYANGGGIIHQPEPYARLLLSALGQTADDPQARERIKDDARAFRSWVEGNQLELAPVRENRSFPHLRINPAGV